MYREQWIADILGNRSVLSCALDVHMTVRGSLERPPQEQDDDIRALRAVVAAWCPDGATAFDEAVLSVLRAALAEAGVADTAADRYAVFIQMRNKNRAVDQPCLDPLDFGIGNEPYQCQLLRRGRVGLFSTHDAAERALRRTCELNYGADFLKRCAFLILPCHARTSELIVTSSSGGER
jgi:hypothetical protein